MRSLRLSQPRSHRRGEPATERWRAREVVALAAMVAIYWLEIQPQARRELVVWERRAREIPDPALRAHALHKLTHERLNAEAAALFAVLAPREQRARVVPLMVAYQVLYDYLDAVNESAEGAELRSGLQLHRALTDALLPARAVSDPYVYHPARGDGGYARALIDACRLRARALPAMRSCASVLASATERCGEAQSYNHAINVCGEAPLIAWSLAHAQGAGHYYWWELAAAGISCLAIHALIACAADPLTEPADAARLDAAYFPGVCAFSALLDSLADYQRDAGSDNHSFVAHYRSRDHAAERLVAVTTEATRLVRRLPHGPQHGVIVAAICAYYLSSTSVRHGFPTPAAEGLLRSIGHVAIPLQAMVRARRLLHGVRIRRATRQHARPTGAAPARLRAAATPGRPIARGPSMR